MEVKAIEAIERKSQVEFNLKFRSCVERIL